MAFVDTPTGWLAGYTYADSKLSIPIAALTELTAAEADAVTGDIREIVFALLAAFYTAYAALETAAKPTYLTISRTSAVDSSGQTIIYEYKVLVTISLTPGSVKAEPA